MPYLTYRGDQFGLAALTEHSTAWSCPPCSAPLTQFRAQHLLAGALRLTGQLSTSPNHSLAWRSLIQPCSLLSSYLAPNHLLAGAIVDLSRKSIGQLSTSPSHSLAGRSLIQPHSLSLTQFSCAQPKTSPNHSLTQCSLIQPHSLSSSSLAPNHLLTGAVVDPSHKLIGQLSTSPSHSLAGHSLIQPHSLSCPILSCLTILLCPTVLSRILWHLQSLVCSLSHHFAQPISCIHFITQLCSHALAAAINHSFAYQLFHHRLPTFCPAALVHRLSHTTVLLPGLSCNHPLFNEMPHHTTCGPAPC